MHAIAGMHDEAVDNLMLTILSQEQSRSPSEIEIAITHLSPSEATWNKLVELYFSGKSTAIELAAPRLFARVRDAALCPICQMLATGVAFKETRAASKVATLRKRRRQMLSMID